MGIEEVGASVADSDGGTVEHPARTSKSRGMRGARIVLPTPACDIMVSKASQDVNARLSEANLQCAFAQR